MIRLARITSELGKNKVQAFRIQRGLRLVLWKQENIDVNVRVHGPDFKSKSIDFIASDDNISADFVVRNDLENATSVEDFKIRLA